MNQSYEIFDLSETLKVKSYPYYFCLLTTPRKPQDALALLWGIASELRFIPLSISNPLTGFMRLTAWRERLTTWKMQNLIDWLNTYEIYFDEAISIKTHWPQYIESEAILLHHSLLLLKPDASQNLIEASKTLGQILGLIYLLQSDHKFDFRMDKLLQEELVAAVKDRLAKVNGLDSIPRDCRCLFSLIGYCEAWLAKYIETYSPITLTEPMIQWAILKQRLKFWRQSKSLKM